MMFTEGLDEHALHWVKQGSRSDKLQSPTRPLPEESSPSPVPDPFPKSPLASYSGSSTCASNFSHVLPPLKFHSGLLAPHRIVSPDDFDEDEDVGDDDGESVASAPSCVNGGACVGEGDGPEVPGEYDCYSVDDMFGDMLRIGGKGAAASLNRGVLLENLRVDVPQAMRRFTSDGETGIRSWGASSLTPGPATTDGRILREHVLLRNSNLSKLASIGLDGSELGTPSAPPVMVSENGIEVESEQGRAFESSADTQRSIGRRCLSDEMVISEEGKDVNMSSSKSLDDAHTTEEYTSLLLIYVKAE